MKMLKTTCFILNYDIYRFTTHAVIQKSEPLNETTVMNRYFLRTFFCDTIMRKMRVKPSMLFRNLHTSHTTSLITHCWLYFKISRS